MAVAKYQGDNWRLCKENLTIIKRKLMKLTLSYYLFYFQYQNKNK